MLKDLKVHPKLAVLTGPLNCSHELGNHRTSLYLKLELNPNDPTWVTQTWWRQLSSWEYDLQHKIRRNNKAVFWQVEGGYCSFKSVRNKGKQPGLTYIDEHWKMQNKYLWSILYFCPNMTHYFSCPNCIPASIGSPQSYKLILPSD